VRAEQSGWPWGRGRAPESEREAVPLDRTDVRRRWPCSATRGTAELVGVADGRPRARVLLSRFSGDDVPLGVDVLRALNEAGLLAAARSRDDTHRFRLSAAGRVAVREATGG
jgi:hypothetical protein